MSFEKELAVAVAAAERAGELIMRDYAALTAMADAPVSISTDTDRGAQEAVLQHLLKAFPGDALCAEETTPTLQHAQRTGARLWIVDPIDGTRGFVMKNGEFSVMVGLIVDAELAVGVVLEPVLKRLTYATRGGGCWWRQDGGVAKTAKASTIAALGEATLIQSHSKADRGPSPSVKAIAPKRVRETYSAGVKLALVARGEGELYVNTYSKFHDWDICAGHLLVTEAGGRVTTLSGQQIRYCQPNHAQLGGLLATNGHVHDEAVRALEGVG
jgi:3'(2'), 5'-bisphosphate nucleotidase